MSQLTQCNFCTFRQIVERQPKERRHKIILRSVDGWLVVCKEIGPEKYEDLGVHFLAITAVCVC